MRPAALAVPEFAGLIEVGNFEDHLARLAEVDWIIEVVVENLKIKQDLLKKVAAVRRPGHHSSAPIPPAFPSRTSAWEWTWKSNSIS